VSGGPKFFLVRVTPGATPEVLRPNQPDRATAVREASEYVEANRHALVYVCEVTDVIEMVVAIKGP
jgi:hypothetical protein